MKSKCSVYCTSWYSPLEISHTLSKLSVSHTINVGRKIRFVNRKREQPLAVHVTQDVKDTRKGVNFIVAAAAELELTNYSALPADMPLIDTLLDALIEAKMIIPKVVRRTSMDYVNLVAKPSLLNKIQTEIYRIQPYQLHKQTQLIVLDYFNSRVSVRQLKTLLADNLKHAALLQLLLKATSLRDAVARLKKESLEDVAATSGHPTFELLYISKERKAKK